MFRTSAEGVLLLGPKLMVDEKLMIDSKELMPSWRCELRS